MNLNKVFVLGNLTRDPEKRVLPSGQPVVNFGLASNRYYTDKDGQRQEDTEFHNIVIFGRTADIASQYLKKGSLALIEGRLKTRTWQDQQGVKHYRTEIIAERLQLGPRSAGSNTASAYQNQPSYQAPQSSAGYNQASVAENEIPIIEESTPEKEPEKTNEHFFEPNEDEINVEEIPF